MLHSNCRALFICKLTTIPSEEFVKLLCTEMARKQKIVPMINSYFSDLFRIFLLSSYHQHKKFQRKILKVEMKMINCQDSNLFVVEAIAVATML